MRKSLLEKPAGQGPLEPLLDVLAEELVEQFLAEVDEPRQAHEAAARKPVGASQPEQEGGDAMELMIMEGFEYLQRAYVVVRDGEEAVAPTEKCSDAELQAEALRREAQGNLKHAKELERYIAERQRGAVNS